MNYSMNTKRKHTFRVWYSKGGPFCDLAKGMGVASKELSASIEMSKDEKQLALVYVLNISDEDATFIRMSIPTIPDGVTFGTKR